MNDKPSVSDLDQFARIAAQNRVTWNEKLEQPVPARFAAKVLPAMKAGGGSFPKAARIDSDEGVARGLEALRKRHMRFLANHAPPLAAERLGVPLERFQWRLETPRDREDFAAVLEGGGEWAEVVVPHFGPPEGRATAFYRTTFTLSPDMLARGAVFVRFRGVDYKAHVFVNGAYLGSHEGFFAPFEFDCTAQVRAGGNTLLVKVENDAIMMGNSSWDGPSSKTSGDKLYAATGPGYDDPEVGWHHCPPAMGIYQPVSIEARARVHVSDLFVRALPESEAAEARLEVFNCDVSPRKVSVEISVYGRNFKGIVCERRVWHPHSVSVPGLSDMNKPDDNRVISLEAGPGINYFTVPVDMPGFRWWSPESPWLYQAQVRLIDAAGRPVDSAERQFGMRTFAIDETTEPKGTPLLNGRPIRLRGANTMGFEQLSVMRGHWERLRDDILLAKLSHMNFLRLTQRPVQDEVYEWCDRLGMMTQTDLPLFGCLRRSQFVEAIRQCGEMERLVRSHPCNVLVSYINEPFPNANGNPCRHLTRPELEEFFTAAGVVVRLMNPDRVIKPVDGDYDPPAPGLPDIHCYNGWYLSNGVGLGELHKGFWQKVKPGWNFACGEFGAEGIDGEETMRRYYPRSWLPGDGENEADWTPSRIRKSQTGAFHFMWFERPDTLAGWVDRSQRHQAWVTKLMTEAFRRNPRMVSFAVHHFIDAFPAGWMKSIMDVDRRPKLAYHAYRDALTPVMVSLRSDRRAFFAGERIRIEAWVCNDRESIPKGAQLRYALFSGDRILQQGRSAVRVRSLAPMLAGHIPVKIPADAPREGLSLRAALLDGRGILLHENEIELRVFARPRRGESVRVRVVGRRRGPAERLVADLGLRHGKGAGVLLVDSFAALSGSGRAAIARAVAEGAHAILLNLPPGSHGVAGEEIAVEPCAMGPRHFVSRAPDNPLLEDFGPEDFKFWYDPALDRPAPILETVIDAPAWDPILTSGNPGTGGEWVRRMAVATKRVGPGRWTICQVSLGGRLHGNPVAETFARRLLAPAGSI